MSKSLIYLILSFIFPEENQGDDNGYQESEYDQDKYIFGPPLDILSRVEAIEYMHKALQFAQHHEGITERQLHDMERIGQLVSRLQIDGKKQRKVDDYFRPKTD